MPNVKANKINAVISNFDPGSSTAVNPCTPRSEMMTRAAGGKPLSA